MLALVQMPCSQLPLIAGTKFVGRFSQLLKIMESDILIRLEIYFQYSQLKSCRIF
jgi:hypothetical protein